MSKNIFNYIQMGLRSNKKIAENEAEKNEKKQADAQAFNKAFTDKTYTVAKKVIENVEKVADYDYESFFSRVNKVFDDKTPNQNKTIDPTKRQERSKVFDEKIKGYNDKFNIEDYPQSQKNYKDSIIEKTKKNIQKKMMEAELRQQPGSDEPSETFDKKPENRLLNKYASENKVESPEIKISTDSKINLTKISDELKALSADEKPLTSEVKTTVKADKLSVKAILEPIAKAVIQPIVKEIAEAVSEIDAQNIETESVEEENNTPTVQSVEKVEPKENLLDAMDTDTVTKSTVNLTKEKISKKIKKYKVDMTKEETPIDLDVDTIESIDYELDHSILADEPEQDYGQIPSYSKASQNKNSKYYKKKRREKFAKRMKVELEDTIIAEKQRKLSRLFKFSLAFKLSFVFVFLLIITIVTLSVSFYFGIDYVISLKEAGLLEDIQFFKDVLMVLLIIFNLVAILLCISIGTKASRELVRPIDEMTRIVKQINAKEMDRRLNIKGMHDELKELAITFNEMLDRIENSYETQNRFTSDASHELRTPIAVIQGYINMLDRWGKADGEILDESIEAIKSESHNMKRLTEKLLLLAKADKGILELEFKPFALNELILEISRETSMIDHNHKISNTINDVEHILADRESLKQAIRIFVDNSVKYTPDGGEISINSYFNKKKIYIEIADNGIGISKEDMDNIFNRFYRVDKSRTKESGGHGLGLSIAKWIVNQHKGEIEVKSELNKGTVITIILSPMA